MFNGNSSHSSNISSHDNTEGGVLTPVVESSSDDHDHDDYDNDHQVYDDDTPDAMTADSMRRLLKVKRTIQKLSQETQQQKSLSPRMLRSSRNRQNQQDDDNDADDNNDNNDDNENKEREQKSDKDARASFHLGVELFQQDPYMMERAVQDSLDQVEKELKYIAARNYNSSSSNNNENRRNNNDSSVSRDDGRLAGTGNTDADYDTADVHTAPTNNNPDELRSEAHRLKMKIAFLRECSEVRALIEKSIQFSTTTTTTTTTSDNGGGGGTSSSTLSSSNDFPDLVQSAKFLVSARKSLECIVVPDPAGEEDDEDTNFYYSLPASSASAATGNNNNRGSNEKIIDSIRTSIRRQRVQLLRRVKTLWQSCVDVSTNSIAVRNGKNAATSTSSSSSQSSTSSPSLSPLQLAYDTLEILSPPPPSSDGESSGYSFGPELEDILRTFVKKLHTDIFFPALERHHNNTTGRGGATTKTKYTFHESVERGSTFNNISTGSSSTTVVTTRAAAAVSHGSISSNKALLGPVRRLEWNITEEQGNNEEYNDYNISQWKETFGFLQKILSFVVDRVLLGRKCCTLVGNRLFGMPQAQPIEQTLMLNLNALGLESRSRLLGNNDHGLLLDPLLQRLKLTCIPTPSSSSSTSIVIVQPSELSSIASSLRSLMDPFVEFLVSANLIPPSATKPNRLVTFASSFEQLYVDQRRCTILNEGRRLLQSSTRTDYHNTTTVGEEIGGGAGDNDDDDDDYDCKSVFALHRCSVSTTAFAALELCRRTMDEAVVYSSLTVASSSPLALLPAVLYRSAREVLDLFRAIVPVKYGYEIKHVPRTAAIFHNDCVYLAHHCLTLGLEYKEKFASSTNDADGSDDPRGNLVRQTCMFVDMVPLFRNLADKSMGDMLDLQAKQIVEIVGQRIPLFGAALACDEIMAEWSDADQALDAGLYHLRHLHQAWLSILSDDILTRSMWYLSDVVFTLLLDQVMSANDISTTACQFVSTLFEKATYQIKELIVPEDTATNAQPQHNKTNKSRVYDRFYVVGQLMDMTLSDIQVGLSRGVFKNITGKELTGLIVATFDESPKRRNVINLLQQTNNK